MIKRLSKLIHRNIAAVKLGLPLFRGIGRFKLPLEIISKGEIFKLNYALNDKATANLVFIEVFLDDCYRLKLINDRINKILDIGANMGFASLNMLLKFNPDLMVCYEPNPNLIEILTKNLSGSKHLFIENKGIGKKAGKAVLNFVERESEVVTGLTKTSFDENGTVVIDSFRSIIEKHGPFDLVKMDCEGAEWEFLTEDSWKNVKYLTMEYHLSSEDIDKSINKLHDALKLHFSIIEESKIDNLTGMILARNKMA